jgi:endonuclease YncB( thermonuclease family)
MSTAFPESPDRRPFPFPLPQILSVFLVILLTAAEVRANELEEIPGCSFEPADWADGDSFFVKLPGGKKEVFRLYFVDCIEMYVSDVSDARRIREQSRYFGVDDVKNCVEYGKRAAEFTAAQLQKPFTVYTAYAEARGRSGKPRYYAMIKTAEGHDLAQLLVQKGLARTFGVGRELPDGTLRDDWESNLKDLELSAAIRRIGIWKLSNPDQIVAMRQTEREEAAGLAAIDDALSIQPPESPVDVNRASLEELVRTGLRESLAEQVIRNRPFRNIAELENIKGIGPVTMTKILPFLKIEP